jgi:MFS transporter, DHA1 family, multidrug resistance protein
MQGGKYFFTILILGALVALGPFSIDMYLPAFPSIAKALNTTTAEVALSLSSFFIGISAGQLLYGPLYDRFGRKIPLIIGLSAYIVASLFCVYTKNIEMLVIMRFVQAIGGCAAGVAATVSVRDLFPVNENAKIFSMLMLVLGTSPMIAPTVGGYLAKALGWQSIFITLAILAILMLLAVIFALPTVYKPNPAISLKPGPILRNFATVIKVPQFYTYAAAGAVVFSGLFAYISASPMIFMEMYKISGEVYGWIFALLSVGFIGSSQINSLMLKKYKSEDLVKIALIGQVVVSLFFLTGAFIGFLNLYSTIGLLFLYLSALGFIAPNASALTMAPFTENAGSASSLMGASQLFLGAIASIGITLFKSQTAVPLGGVMVVASVIALGIVLLGRKKIYVKEEMVLGE